MLFSKLFKKKKSAEEEFFTEERNSMEEKPSMEDKDSREDKQFEEEKHFTEDKQSKEEKPSMEDKDFREDKQSKEEKHFTEDKDSLEDKQSQKGKPSMEDKPFMGENGSVNKNGGEESAATDKNSVTQELTESEIDAPKQGETAGKKNTAGGGENSYSAERKTPSEPERTVEGKRLEPDNSIEQSNDREPTDPAKGKMPVQESFAEEHAPEETNSAENDSGETNSTVEHKKGFFARLKEGLTKTRNNIVRGIDSLFNGFSAIDDDFYEELEEILIMGDIGVNATTEIVARLKAQIKEQHIKEPKECKQLLIEGIKEQMRVDATAYDFEKKQSVIMVIGVNGVGKTTSVGKLAGKLKDEGRRVLIAAADTFRAAAGDQLAEWARRADVPMVGGNEGADPASVVFDAVNAAKARGVDVLLIDTAGRLHNKKNLMEELRKMNRIIDREFPDAHRENLIVLDGTTGQNALVQAREFGTVADLTGIILTKMDGTAKGGIAVAIQSELHIPVKYIGVGETIEDLQKFDSNEFVNALFDVKQDEDN